MYITFTFGYTELACAIPKAGGLFDYATKALGKKWGFIGGMAQIIEFTFAPPAIAFGIGAYLHPFIPEVPILAIAIAAFFLFTALNILGVEMAALFELLVTIVAVIGLVLFAGVTLPHFEMVNLELDTLPFGYKGIFAAIPFAIWFFLAIEGVANVAEETVNPQRNVLIGFGSALFTLVILCLFTFTTSIGVAGWEGIVYPQPGAEASDSPLPLALANAVGEGHAMYKVISVIALFGLVASFHGIILAAGRVTYQFGRTGYAPKALGNIHAKFKTPSKALVVNMLIGIIALLTGKTGEIITIACFGALSLYIVAMISLFALRRNEPDMERPFKVPMYPLFPAVALLIASICLVAISIFNPMLAGIYFGMILLSYLWFQFFYSKKDV
ncbi:MAG TPA: amino acid permease, partial [Flavobacteriales bacterium]|nr:amino acid permease [Flavobacteriales bacterium]